MPGKVVSGLLWKNGPKGPPQAVLAKNAERETAEQIRTRDRQRHDLIGAVRATVFSQEQGRRAGRTASAYFETVKFTPFVAAPPPSTRATP
jgi:hypothetical protein